MDIQLPQIIFQLINFSVVLGALTYLLYKPILKIFKDRSDKIEAGQKAAEENLATQNKIEEYKAKVKKEAEKKAAQILEEATQAAEKRKAEVVAQAKKDAKAEKAKAQEEITAQKKQLMTKAQAEMRAAVMEVAKKVIGQSLDKKAQTKLIDQELKAIIQSL